MIIFAGIPPITQLSGNCPRTTAPAATTLLSPMIVPSKIVTFAPIQQFLPILTPTPLTGSLRYFGKGMRVGNYVGLGTHGHYGSGMGFLEIENE